MVPSSSRTFPWDVPGIPPSQGSLPIAALRGDTHIHVPSPYSCTSRIPSLNRGFARRGGAVFTSVGVEGGKERRKEHF